MTPRVRHAIAEALRLAFVVTALGTMFGLACRPAAAQAIRFANASAVAFRGWVRTVVDTEPPHAAGALPDGTRYVVARKRGLDLWAVDVHVRLAAGERRAVDLAAATPTPRPAVALPAGSLLEHFGGWAAVGGVPLGLRDVRVDGAAVAAHLAARITPMLHVDLWARWYPDQPGMLAGEVVVCASNGAIPDMQADVAAPLRLTWGDGWVGVLGAGPEGRGWGEPIVPAGTSFADGQARSVPFAIGWPRHLDAAANRAEAWGQFVTAAQLWVCSVGVDRLWPDGNPTYPPGFDAERWTAQLWPEAKRRLHTWEPGVVGPNPRSTDTGAQEDQVFVRGECMLPGGVGAELVGYLAALEQASRPGHHLEADGRQADPLAHPNCVFWSGRPHWHLGVSPDQLGKPRGLDPDETHGWGAFDREHWLTNTLAAAARLRDSPALQWELEQQARAFLFGETVRAGWSTSNADAARSVGWAGITAVHLWRNLEDRALAERVRVRWEDRCRLVYLPQLGARASDVWDVRVDDPRLGAGPMWMAWQQSIGSYGLWLAAREFGQPFVRALALRGAKACLQHNWIRQGNRFHGVGNIQFPPPPPAAYEGRAWPEPWFETTWDLPSLFVVLQEEPGNAKARAVWQQAMGDLGNGRRSWVPPGEIPAAPLQAMRAMVAEPPAVAAAPSVPTTLTTTVERHGITWTLAEPALVGAFANGDPFVVGPCTVVAIAPGVQIVGGRVMNGSMLNRTNVQGPFGGAVHGWDSGVAQFTEYRAALNDGLRLPLAMVPGDSLVSVLSDPQGQPGSTIINSASVLTVLAAAPTEPVFRPWYYGPIRQETPYRLADLDLDRLTETFAPSLGARLPQLADQMERLWLIPGSEWDSYLLHPKSYMPPYYRERGLLLGRMFAALNSQRPAAEKRRLAIALCQYAIDLEGAVRNGVYWGATHSPQRKQPMVFAGLLLGGPMLDVNALCPGEHDPTARTPRGHLKVHTVVFGDDQTTFYVEETSPGVFNGGHGGYTRQHVGMAEWSQTHGTDPSGDNVAWDLPYRVCCWANGWTLMALSLRAMGAMKAWDHQAWFDYVDRHIAEGTLRGAPPWQLSYDEEALELWRSLRGTDLRGVRTVGVAGEGAPQLRVTIPAHVGSFWSVEIDARETGPRIGLLVRARDVARRPDRSFLGFPTSGLVFLDDAMAEAALPFALPESGRDTLQIPPAGFQAGDEYALQAVMLFGDGELRPTNAVQVRVLPPEGR